MVARIDWLNNCLDRMIEGKRPDTPEKWGRHSSIVSKDVDLLRMAANFMSLRADASEPDAEFMAQARRRIVAEAASAE